LEKIFVENICRYSNVWRSTVTKTGENKADFWNCSAEFS